MSAGAPSAIASRAAPAARTASAATLAVAIAALASLRRDGPMLLALAAGAATLAAVVIALVRRHGLAAAWIGAIGLAILAGEMSAVPFGGQSGRLLWADAVVVGGLVVALLRGGLALRVPRAPILIALLPWLAWSSATMLLARDPLTAIAELKEWIVALAVLGAALAFAREPSRARWLLGTVVLVSVAVAGWMIVVALHSPVGWVLAVLLKNVDLPWGRTNYLAGILILGIPLTCGFLGGATRLSSRLALLAALVIQGAGLAFSASKGAILALVLALVVGFPSSRASRRSAIAMVAMLVAGVLLFEIGPLHEVLSYRLQQSAIDYSVGERMDLYQLAWESFLSHPVTGIGINNFSVVSNRLTGVDTVPHNLELGMLAEGGLPGALLTAFWILVFGRLAWRSRSPEHGAARRALGLGVWTAFLGFVLHNQTESTLYGEQYKILLVLVAAAAWSLAGASRVNSPSGVGQAPPLAVTRS